MLSDHPQLKSGGAKLGPDEWVSTTLCAPGSRASCLSHEQVISIEASRPSHIGTRPAEATHFNYPTGEQAPAGLRLGPHLRENPKWLLKRAHDLMRKHPRSQHGLGWPSLCPPPGHQGNKRYVQTALSRRSQTGFPSSSPQNLSQYLSEQVKVTFPRNSTEESKGRDLGATPAGTSSGLKHCPGPCQVINTLLSPPQ